MATIAAVFTWPLPARLASVTAFGYAVGCLNAAYYLVQLRRRADVRDLHSGNAGATNAGRVLGRRGFIAVFVLDAAKGALAATIGCWVAGAAGGACGGIAAVAGHVWPAQLGFRGGKGIATAIGAFLVLEPVTLLCVVALAGALFAVSRRWSASGLMAVAVAPLVALALGRPLATLATIAAAVAVILGAHRGDLAESRAAS